MRPALRRRSRLETDMKALIAAALLMAASTAQAMTIETASGDWSDIPLMKSRGYSLNEPVITRVYDLVRTGSCTIEGQSRKKLDMTVPFLVHYRSDGTPDRLVLSKIGCAEAESVIGGALVVLVDKGQFQSTGVNRAGWYRSEVSFSYS